MVMVIYSALVRFRSHYESQVKSNKLRATQVFIEGTPPSAARDKAPSAMTTLSGTTRELLTGR